MQERSSFTSLRSVALFFNSFVLSGALQASEALFFDDTPVILSATRLQQPLSEVPASVTVIDREMIENSGIREVAELMRLVPGFVVGNYAGNEPSVSYLGLGSQFARQIQMLVDGRSVYIPTYGGIPWASLPLLIDDIERLEVIRGPNSAAFGANSFLAVINITTRQAAEDQGGRFRYSGSGNSQNTVEDFYASYGGHLGKTNWRLSSGKQSDSGYAARFDSESTARINWRSETQLNLDHQLIVMAGYADSTLGKGKADANGDSTGDGVSDSVDLKRDELSKYQYVSLQYEINGLDSSTQIRLFRNHDQAIDHFQVPRLNERFADLLVDQPLVAAFIRSLNEDITYTIDFDRESDRTEIELQQTELINDDLRWVYGGSMRKDAVRSFYLFNDLDTHELEQKRLFSHVEWRFKDNWLLNLGASVENTTITHSAFSPRLALVYRLNEQHSFRSSLTQAIRNPILYEADGHTQFVVSLPDSLPPPVGGLAFTDLRAINHRVDPEEIRSLELGWYYQNPARTFSSDFKLSKSRIDQQLFEEDQIDTLNDQFDGYYRTIENGQSTEIYNLEWAWALQPNPQWALHNGISLTRAESASQELEDSFPERIAHLMSTYKPDASHRFNLLWYHTSSLSWTDSSHVVPSSKNLDIHYIFSFNNKYDSKLHIAAQKLLEDSNDYLSENYHDKTLFMSLSSDF